MYGKRWNPHRYPRRNVTFSNGQAADGSNTLAAAVLAPPFVPRSAGDEAAAEPRVCQQLTRHNFAEALPVVKEALSQCSFFSFDCEMTGLFPEGQREDYLDDYEER